MSALFKATDPGFYFGDHYIRIARDFTTRAGTAKDFGLVAKDVASALGMRDAEKFARMLAKDQLGTQIVGTNGGDQSMTVVSEDGFYEGVILSRKPEGKALRNLVTREILPTLRKTGSYQVQPAPVVPQLRQSEQVLHAVGADYALLDDDGKLAKIGQLSRGKGFDVLLTANGFDHALLGAPGEHGRRFRLRLIWRLSQIPTTSELRRIGRTSGVRFPYAIGNGNSGNAFGVNGNPRRPAFPLRHGNDPG